MNLNTIEWGMAMNLLQLDIELLEQLAGAYTHARVMFNHHDLTKVSPRKQRKIRKWLSGQYIELIGQLPEEFNIFSPENTDQQVLCFLKECEDGVNTQEAQRKETFDKEFSRFEPQVKEALWELVNSYYCPLTFVSENQVEFEVFDGCSFRKTLILNKVQGLPRAKEGYYFSHLQLRYQEDENRFYFSGEMEDWETEEPQKFLVTFKDPTVELQVYNAWENAIVGETPWELLETVCDGICEKAEQSLELCNQKERELLPLLKEIKAMNGIYWGDVTRPFTFPLLKQVTREFGIAKAEKLLCQMEGVLPFSKQFEGAQKQLVALFCQQKNQPFWRYLCEKIETSQAEYPIQVQRQFPEESLTALRAKVQTLMEEKGFEGTYPDFVKKGQIKGMRLAHSYDMSYFISGEKRVEFHVYCKETATAAGVYLEFLCGTACLKKNEPTADIYDCMFNAKGRRLFQTVSYTEPLTEEDRTERDDLETVVTIAAKKAQCQKLTKAEREYCYHTVFVDIFNFCGPFFIAGGLFGVAMTVCLMIVCALFCLIEGTDTGSSSLFGVFPWGWILAFCWVAFGGALGIIEMLSKRK